MKKLILALVAVGVVSFLPFFMGDLETRNLDDGARASLKRPFALLSDGLTHYELAGPENGEVVVLVHGNAAPYFSWEHNVKALTGAGYRVLTYDLYGFGYSDRPDKTYNRALYDRQLMELLEALEIPTPVNLIGTSQGGSIAVHFAAHHPGKVKRLGLLAPFINILPMKAVLGLLKLPMVGEYLTALAMDRINLNYPKKVFGDPDKIPESFLKQYREQLSYRGFKRARLSNIRSDALADFTEDYRKAGQLKIPLLLTWGTSDRVIKADSIANIRKAIPGIRYKEIPGGGHVAHYEKPGLMNPILLEFLKSR